MDIGKSARSSSSNGINNLPCNIIDNILKYLSLRDAVRTSILSKEWRYKWLTIPNLVFDHTFNHKVPEKHKATIIYQVLLLHKGAIRKFKLDHADFENSDSINNWIQFLSGHHVREFDLNFSRSNNQYHALSSHLFTFDHLKHLGLGECEFKPPPTFKGFANLVRLQFDGVTFLPEKFASFISNCPLLEHLSMEECDDFEALEFDAPKLKLFNFYGDFGSISFKKTPLLEDVSLTLMDFERYGQESKLVEVFGHLASITTLELNSGALQYFARGGIPGKLPYVLNHLKGLSVCGIAFDSIHEVSCLVCLLRSSPNLESLEMTCTFGSDEDEEPNAALWLLKALETCGFSLSQLKYVKMQLNLGLKTEMEFIKLLLTVATTLEKLEIWSHYAFDGKPGCQMLMELTRFRRASSKAEIIFLDSEFLSGVFVL